MLRKESILSQIKDFCLELLFPKFCVNCGRDGAYLCQDCLAMIDISDRIFRPQGKLSCLYFASDYNNFIIKKLITKYKYQPFAKDLAKTLSSIIIIYFQNLESPPIFLAQKKDFVFVPIPLFKKRLRWRGFNQSEEISRHLSEYLNIPISKDVLAKTRETIPQAKLSKQARKKNLKGVFVCQKPDLIKDKRVLLVDDVFTTGTTMEEAARILKKAGAKQVLGIAVARR